MAPKKASSGGSFVKMKTFANAAAILFEPTKVDLEVPNQKFGGTQDIIHTDITVFDKEALSGGDPMVVKGAMNTETAIVSSLKDEIGEQIIGVLKLKPSKFGNDFYTIAEPDDAVFEAVCQFIEQRDAKVKAAMDSDGPAWDDDDDE